MLIRSAPDLRDRDATPPELALGRRRFLRTAAGAVAATAGAVWLPGCAEAEGEGAAAANGPAKAPRALGGVRPGPASFSTDERQTSYEDATAYNNFYEFGTDKSDPARYAGTLRTEPWSVVVEGEVAKPGRVPLEDLLGPHALEERIYRLRCVEAWSMVIPWVGIPLGDVLKRFQPTSKARFVAFETLQDPEQMPGQKRRIRQQRSAGSTRRSSPSRCYPPRCSAGARRSETWAPTRWRRSPTRRAAGRCASCSPASPSRPCDG